MGHSPQAVRGSRPPALRSVGTVGWNWRASVATTAQPQAAPQQPVASMAARTATVPQIRCTTLTPSRRWVAKGVEGSPIRSSARGGKVLTAGARLWASGNELAHASPVTSATGLAVRGPVPIPYKAESEYSQPGATGLTLRGSGADSGTRQLTRASRGPSRRTGWSSRLLLDRAMRGAARRRVQDPAVRASTRV